MLPLKSIEPEKNDVEKNKATESKQEEWEKMQIDIFTDIIISILMKSKNLDYDEE